jgi:hypothetical protein
MMGSRAGPIQLPELRSVVVLARRDEPEQLRMNSDAQRTITRKTNLVLS